MAMSMCPFSRVSCSGLIPPTWLFSTGAGWWRSRTSTHAVLPWLHASCKGVQPAWSAGPKRTDKWQLPSRQWWEGKLKNVKEGGLKLHCWTFLGRNCTGVALFFCFFYINTKGNTQRLRRFLLFGFFFNLHENFGCCARDSIKMPTWPGLTKENMASKKSSSELIYTQFRTFCDGCWYCSSSLHSYLDWAHSGCGTLATVNASFQRVQFSRLQTIRSLSQSDAIWRNVE